MPEDTKPDQEAESTEKGKTQSSSKPSRRRRKTANRAKSVDAPAKEASTGAPRSERSSPSKAKGMIRHEVKPTVRHLAELKGKKPIVGLTAYDAIMGKLISDAEVDFILVGDSVGTTLLGHETTIPVTIEDMVRHTSAVRRSDPGCLLVADLPFGEASLSFDRLLESCRRLMQEGGADAVKLEGGRDLADDVEKLVATGIPVLGHIGLLPQTVKAIGGYRRFGADRDEAESLYTDAISLEEAGCFAIIAEMVEGKVAAELANQITPPLVGIGSGPDCDGQILVTTDLLGTSPDFIPKHIRPEELLRDRMVGMIRGWKDGLAKRNP